jgi:hypothetical protein
MNARWGAVVAGPENSCRTHAVHVIDVIQQHATQGLGTMQPLAE